MAVLTSYDLAAALTDLGPAEIFVGDMLVAGGMVNIGAIEGDVRVAAPHEINALTARRTGGAKHQARVTPGDLSVVAPVNVGDAGLIAMISPTGTKGIGFARSQKVQETSVMVIPVNELGGGLSYVAAWERLEGNGIAAASGAAAAPVNSLFIWRAYLSFGEIVYTEDDGGKSTTDVTISPMYAAVLGGNVIQDGHRLMTWKDPRSLTPAFPILT